MGIRKFGMVEKNNDKNNRTKPNYYFFFIIKTTVLLENIDIHKTCATRDLMGGAHFCFERTNSEI